MPNALIFSPNFVGHRQVHAFVHAHLLKKLGYNICIAGNFSTICDNLSYLQKLFEDDRIIKIDTSNIAGNGLNISNTEFAHMQKEYSISLTVFVEADCFITLLISQLIPQNNRFQGRLVGLFLTPWDFYFKLGLIYNLRYIKNLIHTWKTDADTRFFHKFLNNTFNLIDVSLYNDEYVVSKIRKGIYLPDVCQQYVNTIICEENTEQRIWIERLAEFKNKNRTSFIILYFGTAQKRRGYDNLLQLAIDNDACFVHCGLRNNKDKYNCNVDELRGILENRKKLFETNEFITDTFCIDYFFKSVSHLVLPYDKTFFGSSGIMLQALSYGIPVLVSDCGLIGYQVKKYKLGITFSEDLSQNQFLHFINIPKESFSYSIEQFMKLQSLDRFESVLINAYTG